MNYTRFRFRAVVDFVQFEIQTTHPTNFHTVKRRGNLRRAVALDKGPGGAATRFLFELHDPQSWAEVVHDISVIASQFDLAVPPTITSIEVSFDAYSKGATSSELVELAAGFVKRCNPVSTNRRLSGRAKHDVEGLWNHDNTVRRIAEGRVVSIGSRTDEKAQRIYFKTTDNGEPLPESKHRARLEITLQGDALPARTFDEWQRFDFATLAPYFKFRTLKDRLDPLISMVQAHVTQIGERKTRKRRGGGTRLYDRTTRADDGLNAKAYDALRRLTGRMQSQLKGIQESNESETLQFRDATIACGFYGQDKQETPCESKGAPLNSNNYTIEQLQQLQHHQQEHHPHPSPRPVDSEHSSSETSPPGDLTAIVPVVESVSVSVLSSPSTFPHDFTDDGFP